VLLYKELAVGLVRSLIAQTNLLLLVLALWCLIFFLSPIIRNTEGMPIQTAVAKRIAGAAIAEAELENWTVAVAIVDTHGSLCYFEKMDDTQIASATVAIEKAKTAAVFKRSSKALEGKIYPL
jgi:hypothetical protein